MPVDVSSKEAASLTDGDRNTCRWTAELDWQPDVEPSPHELDDWKVQLLDVFGGVRELDGLVTLTVFVQASHVCAAVESAIAMVEPITGYRVTGVRVLPFHEHERRRRNPTIPALAGDADIGTMAGVTVERVRELHDLEDFPPAVTTTEASGPLSLRIEVLRWLSERDPKTGLPRDPPGEAEY